MSLSMSIEIFRKSFPFSNVTSFVVVKFPLEYFSRWFSTSISWHDGCLLGQTQNLSVEFPQ